jgi:hypothetical protein
MGVVLTGIVYVSGYLSLILVAVCLACGLYYIAELAEEYTVLTKRLIAVANVAVLLVHALLFMFEPQLPHLGLAIGFTAHVCYFWLLQSFPFFRILSPAGLLSLVLLGAAHYVWATHFFSHFHQVTHVLCFFIFNVWLVPFGFFISLSINESTLPNAQAASAQESFTDGARTKQKSGIVSAFSFMQQKRDEVMPSMSKKV